MARWICSGILGRDALVLLLLAAGCTGDAPGTQSTGGTAGAAGPQAARWRPFPLPAYAKLDLAEARVPAANEIEASRQSIEALYLERELLPRKARWKIRADDKAYLAQDYVREALVFRRQRDLTAYRESTADTGDARAKGAAFFEEYVRLAAQSPDAKSRDQIAALGDAATAAGSRDPLLMIYLAWLKVQKSSAQETLERVESLAPRLSHPKIPALCRSLAAIWLHSIAQMRGADELDNQKYLYGAIDAVIANLAEEAGHPNQRVVWHAGSWTFYNGLKSEQQAEFLSGCWSNGKVHPFITNLAAGMYFHAEGWRHRGGGFADTVTEEGWKKFGENMRLARDHFVRAWRAAPQHPEPPAWMIKVAMAGGESRWSTADWFYETVSTQLDYIPAYEHFEWSLRPRWGGSYPQLLSLASQCAATGRYDTNVPLFASTILWSIQSELDDPHAVAAAPGVVQLVQACADGLAAAVEQGGRCPGNHAGNWGYFASLLSLAGDYAGAKAILAKQGDAITQSCFDWARRKASHVKGLCHAMTGPAKDRIVSIQETLREAPSGEGPPDYDALLNAIAAARETDAQPETQGYFDDLETMTRQLRDYDAGEWVRFPFDENLSGWYASGVKIERLGDNEVRATSEPGSLGIVFRPLAKFAPPFVCEAELAMAEPGQRGKNFIGVLYGTTDCRGLYSAHEPRGIMLSPFQDIVRLHQSRAAENALAWYIPQREYHHLRVKVWPEHVIYSVDHENLPTQKTTQLPWMGQFTIGEATPVAEANTLRIRNVRLRKLSYGPPPDNSWDQHRAFYLAEEESDPLSPSAPYQLGRERFARKDYPAALALFEEAQRRGLRFSGIDYKLGATKVFLERYREAIEHYKKSMAINPEFVDAQIELSLTYSQAQAADVRDAKTALSLAEEVCARTSHQNWFALYALASAHAEAGAFDAALEWFNKSLALAPESKREGLTKELEMLKRKEPLRYSKWEPKPAEPRESTAGKEG